MPTTPSSFDQSGPGRPSTKRRSETTPMPRGTDPTALDAQQDRVRTAVVGLGYWGPNLVRNLHEMPSIELAAVCDLRRDALDAIGRRYPGMQLTTRYDEILADDSIEAVAIATPVSSHYPLAAAALRAGKHVFIEKPITASAQEAEELIALAEENGVVVMPGHTFLYSPP